MHPLAYVGLAGLLLVGWVVSRMRRLQGIPGPWLCAITDFKRAYHQNTRNITIWLGELHKQYGPIVRIGPSCVSFSSASAVPVIYTMHGELKKAESYYCLPTLAEGTVNRSVIDLQDETHNTLLKRGFGSAFSVRNIQKFENYVDEASVGLLDRFGRKGVVDIFDSFRRFQIDFLIQAAFSVEPFACQGDKETDIEDFTFQPLANHWHRWQGLPKLETLIFKNTYFDKLRRMLYTPRSPIWVAMTNDFLNSRLSGKSTSKGQKDLLDQWLNAQEKHSDIMDMGNVKLMVASTVNAGFDSTAFTMTSALYCLMKNPEAKKKLQKEILDVKAQGLLSDPPKFEEVNKLPYLDAVIKETMRLYPFVNLPLERVVPDEGIEVLGHRLPPGTVVGAASSVVGQDKECYGEDVEKFDPDRWINADPARLIAMNKGHLGFGSGKRACMGRYIAGLEMRKTVSHVIANYDLEFQDENPEFVFEDGITSFVKPIWTKFTKLEA